MDKRMNGIERGYIFEEDSEYCNFVLGKHKENFTKRQASNFQVFSAYVKTFSAGTARFVPSAIQLYVQHN
jgi:hypothetical protein